MNRGLSRIMLSFESFSRNLRIIEVNRGIRKKLRIIEENAEFLGFRRIAEF